MHYENKLSSAAFVNGVVFLSFLFFSLMFLLLIGVICRNSFVIMVMRMDFRLCNEKGRQVLDGIKKWLPQL